MYRRILFAFDGNEARGAQAYPHLLALARATQAEVVLCHVVAAGGAMEAPAAADGSPVATAVRSNTRLDQLREQLIGEGISNVKTLVLEGRPAEAIVDASSDLACDVIVMVTAGRSGLTRFFAGSVADDVVREAEGTAVLLLRADGK
jgi:nucleotide-binding universal stress UspA family protein